jgi:hypothetical protein
MLFVFLKARNTVNGLFCERGKTSGTQGNVQCTYVRNKRTL